jgi:hypothetical protein
MSEGDWTECCGNILLLIGLALLIEWARANPFGAAVAGTTFLGVVMVALPLFIFTRRVALNTDMETKQKIKWGVVVGYLMGLFTLISSILFHVVRGLFAVLGVCGFVGTALIALICYSVKEWSKQRGRRQAEALVWELKDQLEQLKEQLDRGVVTQEEYEQKRKLLENQLEEVKSRTGGAYSKQRD